MNNQLDNTKPDSPTPMVEIPLKSFRKMIWWGVFMGAAITSSFLAMVMGKEPRSIFFLGLAWFIFDQYIRDTYVRRDTKHTN